MSRLEEIKERYVKYEYDFNLDKEHIDWLISRVEKLEKDRILLINKNNKHVDFANEYYANYQFEKAETNYLKRQNKRYKQALEFYADDITYKMRIGYDGFKSHKLIELDHGEKARQTLAGGRE